MKDYIKALLFAMEKHKHQIRDTTGHPYVIHPIRVAELLRSAGLPADHRSVLAALLHDTIEDCGVNYGTIRYEFGKEVADVVVGVTDDNRLARKERKADMLDRIGQAEPDVQIVKLADRLDNITDKAPWMHDEKRYNQYLDESLKLLKITKPDDLEQRYQLQDALHMVHLWLHTEVEKQLEEMKSDER